MPKKGGKKGGKKKGGKKKSKKVAGADAIIKRFLQLYERNCAQTESQPCPGIKQALKGCAENETVLSKFILESIPVEKESDKPVLIEPLFQAIRQERYTHIKDVHIWNYPMSYENTSTVASLLEKQCYPIQLVELMDCILEPYSVLRFASSFGLCSTLTQVSLDYNEFGDEGCKNLCFGLEGNTTMLSISLCYCNLGVASGKYLGEMVSTTAVRDLYLDGNLLECEGVIDLVRRLAGQAQYESEQRAEAARLKEEEEALKKEEKSRVRSAISGSGSEADKDSLGADKKKKKKKKGKKKKKKDEGPPPVGPWIRKLHLADNALDGLTHGKEFAPILMTRVMKLLIMFSESLEELDLNKNLIGDLSAKEILEALEHRKEVEKLGGVKLQTTYKIQADTFKAIQKLGAGLKKKKKGKKKKK